MKRSVSLPLLIFLAGIVVAAFVAYSAVKERDRNREIEELITSLQQERDRIRKENDSLQDKVAYLDTTQFQERIAKEKLNMQNPDEKVAIIKQEITETSEQVPAQTQVPSQEEDKPNYLKWYDNFFAY